MAIGYGYLMLGCTEDDDDDDEKTQNKLLILVAKDVRKRTYPATCLRENGVSGYATSWLVSLVASIGVALKTATLLSSPFVELVLRESPIVEHATNGVAESAMREVKRKTRPLKFALAAHVFKIVESHSILKWIPTMAADAISFFSSGKDGLTAYMRRSGLA